MTNIDWPNVGLAVMGVCLLVFIFFALKRQWTITALVVGVLHLPIAFINAVAPFRGLLDPAYPGYVQGLVHADRGVEVALFALTMLLGAVACACIAVLNRPGPRNYFIVGFDALLLLTLAPESFGDLATQGVNGFHVGFGEYLQFSGLPAFLFEAGLLLAPPTIGCVWALRRAAHLEIDA